MFRLFKALVSIALLACFIWFGATVKIGRFTLFHHLSRIWHTEETQELVHSARDEAAPTVERVKRGVQRGIKEAEKSP